MYKNRLQGLDFLRALAITLVFLSHYEFITGFNPFGLMSQFGGLGVYLFFVLRYIYFPTFCRLDGIIFGIGAAFCKNFYSSLWAKLTNFRFGSACLLFGLLGLFAARCLFQAESLAVLSTTLGYTLAGLSSFILLLSAVNPKALLNKWKIPGVSSLALWSYSIYLTQKTCIYFIFQFFGKHFKEYNEGYLCVLAVTLCTLFTGWLLYSFIELPFLKLRDRFKSYNSVMPVAA